MCFLDSEPNIYAAVAQNILSFVIRTSFVDLYGEN